MRAPVILAFSLLASSAYGAGLPINTMVTPENIGATICTHGWSSSVRPPVFYTNAIKKRLMREEGLPLELIGNKILDHKINISLGGAPEDPANMMLQDKDESFTKDHVESCLRSAVCEGRVGLREAQAAIFNNWQSAAGLCSR